MANTDHLTRRLARKVLPRPVRMALLQLTPGSIRARLQRRLRYFINGPQEIKYLPYEHGYENFLLPAVLPPANEGCEQGLPIPPRAWWFEYGKEKEEWLVKGAQHTKAMLEAAEASGLSLAKGDRILEVGCGCGRMLRHLKPLAQLCEIWGTDIWAEQIYWDKRHLSPPFHFATTTTIPHLPFEDRYFKLIYCGSVFTHIDDLAEAWLLEFFRILSPDGRAYITIHDKHALELLDGRYQEYGLAKMMKNQPLRKQSRDVFDMLVVQRDTMSQVFYDLNYFRKTAAAMFEVLSVIPEAYGYQTGILLKRKTS